MPVSTPSMPVPLRLFTAIGSVLACASAYAAPSLAVEFSDGFLLGGQAIDMTRYARGNPLPAGDYAVEVLLNGQFLQRADIHFALRDDPHVAEPCLPRGLLPALQLTPALNAVLADGEGPCLDLTAAVAAATVSFDSSTLQLLLTVPQAAQAREARGHVAAHLRDPGITAGFVDYHVNHHRSQGSDSSYAGLRAGVNFGHWRLRHRASITHGRSGTRHTVIGNQLQRDLPQWNSQLMVGQGTTGGELFDSVGFSGVRVATDERMLPDSVRGYAPVVRGIAEGNAVVSIRQNGVVIHESNVAPGPFVIEDLYPTHFGGDLDVTVTEADGRTQRFTVNFSAVPQALRAGTSRMSAAAGTLRTRDGHLQALRFSEATYARGLNNHLTLLGGAQWGEGYQALLLGTVVNTAVGAFGADITHARAHLPEGQAHGNSYRVNYQRYLADSGTHVGLAAYRYSTQGYRTLGEVAQVRSDDWVDTGRARQRYQLNVTQALGTQSALTLSGGRIAYWGGGSRQNDVQLALQTRVRRANVALSVQRYHTGEGRQDTRYAFNVSVPLGSTAQAPRLGSQLSHSARGGQAQLGVTGALGERRALTYSLSSSHGRNEDSSLSAYAAYQGNHGHFNAGYSRSGHQHSQTLGASGSVVLHPGGINSGAPLGNGFAVVQAKGAEGARIGTGQDLRVSRNGHALLPHVSPYRWNRIDLDPAGLPLDVELLQTSQRVAPTAGSIVRVAFEVRRERTLFIDATDALGQPLPFAARVVDDAGQPRGAVGQGGIIQLRGAQAEGALIVDPDGRGRCRLEYRLPDAPDAYGLSWSQAQCLPWAPPPPLLQVQAHLIHAMPGALPAPVQ
ncbi:fimbrial biogenesis outer membrane usher protein [Stenotrophomonas maltophilia]|uniref:fimbria/pilus outer membrane usher protein n=1 Tax=Stenotrophomonas maltophilia TaxID=40324 RepID=UPI0015DEBB50|nr:fimbria/pilus outer membrane usher protein [Stenotrophomonas maltophilia]MBA0280448.1 fimbrial biogenesis outer membrane usher protein [Stenotrophomonas maltophilia]MBA0345823.1 fimbrial biogenesis outer membrane usher protein [Stenotrophomonas maltophilia]MBA0358968.1 fimbrial biogenesis outer membrane usher protein [Stenotrophomonas maltophilia]MBA0521091.1 fimbrial biogenesis outer membrane usher protein [Stenotrophomonas maltophilia]